PDVESGARVVCLDGPEADTIADQSDTPPTNPHVGPEHAAYIIYTSGSTGRPKGVTVEHRQLARYVANANQWIDLPPGAHYAMVSTVAADLGHTSIFGGLAAGGTVHLLSDEQVGDPDAVADYFRRRAIDCLKIVPSHLSALLSGSQPADALPRKRLVLGG